MPCALSTTSLCLLFVVGVGGFALLRSTCFDGLLGSAASSQRDENNYHYDGNLPCRNHASPKGFVEYYPCWVLVEGGRVEFRTDHCRGFFVLKN